MAAEMIYCPSCNAKVQVPEEMLGQPVQCPLCNLVFTAPTRGGTPPALPGQPPVVLRPADGEESMYPPEVKGPAIALLVAGSLGSLLSLYRLIMALNAGPNDLWKSILDSYEKLGMGQVADMLRQNVTAEGFFRGMLITTGICLFLGLGTILGAWQMLRLRSYGSAIAGSILAMLNFQECCCLLGIPFGIWSLVVLSRPGVRDAFRRGSQPEQQ